MNSDDYTHTDPSFKENMALKLRFVRVKFDRQSNGKPEAKPKEYTYRVDPDVEVLVGQYAITRRNMSRVTVTAVDVEAVPNLDISKYDFVDPVPADELE